MHTALTSATVQPSYMSQFRNNYSILNVIYTSKIGMLQRTLLAAMLCTPGDNYKQYRQIAEIHLNTWSFFW